MVQISSNSRRVQAAENSSENDEGLSVSLEQLWHAYRKEKGQPNYGRLSQQYGEAHGEIRESFYSDSITAVALIIDRTEKKRRKRRLKIRSSMDRGRCLKMFYQSDKVAEVQPEFEQALWYARALEAQGRLLLDRTRHRMLVERLYSVIVYLLGVLDSVDHMTERQPVNERRNGPTEIHQNTRESHDASDDRKTRINKSLQMATKELDNLDRFLHENARAVAMKYYLIGMPLGALGLIILALVVGKLLHIRDVPAEPLVITLIAGGVGAMISVMMRITKGQRIQVDTQAGRFMTLLGGSFRPLIGAILGLALYVLLQAGLLPLTDGGGQETKLYFYAGLAFLAGFSERWAQDMLVRTTSSGLSRTDDAESTPSMPAAETSPAVPSNRGRPAGP